jgi:hypothetical protein
MEASVDRLTVDHFLIQRSSSAARPIGNSMTFANKSREPTIRLFDFASALRGTHPKSSQAPIVKSFGRR